MTFCQKMVSSYRPADVAAQDRQAAVAALVLNVTLHHASQGSASIDAITETKCELRLQAYINSNGTMPHLIDL